MIVLADRDKNYLLRMEEHCIRIEDACKRFGNSLQAFENDADYRDVICMNIFQIGEIANQVSDAVKKELNDVPWAQMYEIRNILAHAYIKPDNRIVWQTVENDIPNLKLKLQEII